MSVCVYVFVCMYLCVHECVCVRSCMCVRALVCLHLCLCAYLFVCVCLPVCVYVHVFDRGTLQMLALELLGNGESRPKVHNDEIQKAIDSLQNESHKVNGLRRGQ